MDLERSGTFIIRINPAGGRRVAQKDPLSKTTDTGHISANQSKSFEWTDLTGRVVVKAWPVNIPRETRDGLRITAGCPVVVDDRLAGHYAQVELDRSGQGTVQQDPYGLHPLYIGRVRDVTLIANRPQLVAVEIERLTGKSAERDHCFAAWLAFIGRPIGDRTGYEDVRCVPFGAGVRIDPDHGASLSFTDAPWQLPAMDIDDSWIDRIECELIAKSPGCDQGDGTYAAASTYRGTRLAPCSCACRSGRIITGRRYCH